MFLFRLGGAVRWVQLAWHIQYCTFLQKIYDLIEAVDYGFKAVYKHRISLRFFERLNLIVTLCCLLGKRRGLIRYTMKQS